MNTGNNILVVQGDILEVYFELENVPAETIEKVFFTCAEKELQVECPYDEQESGFCLRLPSAETDSLPTGVNGYDLTVRFKDENYFTLIYEGAFSVLEKRNKVSGV